MGKDGLLPVPYAFENYTFDKPEAYKACIS